MYQMGGLSRFPLRTRCGLCPTTFANCFTNDSGMKSVRAFHGGHDTRLLSTALCYLTLQCVSVCVCVRLCASLSVFLCVAAAAAAHSDALTSLLDRHGCRLAAYGCCICAVFCAVFVVLLLMLHLVCACWIFIYLRCLVDGQKLQQTQPKTRDF